MRTLRGEYKQLKREKFYALLQTLTWLLDDYRALENGPWTWQANQFNSFQTGGNSYYAFCDYIEVGRRCQVKIRQAVVRMKLMF